MDDQQVNWMNVHCWLVTPVSLNESLLSRNSICNAYYAWRSVIGPLKKFGTLCLLNRCFIDNWLGVWGGAVFKTLLEVDSLILRCQIFKRLIFHLVFRILSQHAGIRRVHWYLNLYLWAAAARQWAAALDLIQTLFSVWLARQCLSSRASLLYFSILTFSCVCSI